MTQRQTPTASAVIQLFAAGTSCWPHHFLAVLCAVLKIPPRGSIDRGLCRGQMWWMKRKKSSKKIAPCQIRNHLKCCTFLDPQLGQIWNSLLSSTLTFFGFRLFFQTFFFIFLSIFSSHTTTTATAAKCNHLLLLFCAQKRLWLSEHQPQLCGGIYFSFFFGFVCVKPPTTF